MHTPGWVVLFGSPQKSRITGGSSKRDAYNVLHTYHRHNPGEPQVCVEEIRVSVALSESVCGAARELRAPANLSERNSLRAC